MDQNEEIKIIFKKKKNNSNDDGKILNEDDYLGLESSDLFDLKKKSNNKSLPLLSYNTFSNRYLKFSE